MGEEGPTLGWRGEQAVALSLTDWIRGREITQAEHEVDAHGHGFLRLRLRGPKSPQLLIKPVIPELGIPGSPKWALEFAAGRTPQIWTPKRSRFGDGPVAVRDLQQLVRKRFLQVVTGAQTQDGLAVARLDFDDNTAALVFPHPLPFGLAVHLVCVVVIRVVFLEAIPTGPYTPGASLLE